MKELTEGMLDNAANAGAEYADVRVEENEGTAIRMVAPPRLTSEPHVKRSIPSVSLSMGRGALPRGSKQTMPEPMRW